MPLIHSHTINKTSSCNTSIWFVSDCKCSTLGLHPWASHLQIRYKSHGCVITITYIYIIFIISIHIFILFCIYAVALASPFTLLIGYYHSVLLRDTNADMLSLDMCTKHLFSANDQSIISTGHSVHHRNWLLLEHVRHMNAKAFSTFCELVKKLWPEIGLQLISGMLIT